MIKHIVVFGLSAESAAQKQDDARELRQILTGLLTEIDTVTAIEVGIDLGKLDSHQDVVLISTHVDNAALEAYQRHPLHQNALLRINQIVSSRAVVDYDDSDLGV